MKEIRDIDVELSRQTTVNTTKGELVYPDLLNCTEEEIVIEV